MNKATFTICPGIPKLNLSLRVLVVLCLILPMALSCEKSSDIDAKMAEMQGVYILDKGEDTWHCPDGSLPDQALEAKLEKVGKTWIFEYYFPYRDVDAWTTVRLCQPVGWDPFTNSYYFAPLTEEDLPRVLEGATPYNWSYSIEPYKISIVAQGIHLNWTK